jgi:hypothetical protein
MTLALSFRSLVPVTFAALACAIAAGCGGTSVDGSGSARRVRPGSTCTMGSQPAGAEDGCNTCTCSAGTWACTEKACVTVDGGGSSCPAGMKMSDGCNECTCVNGQLACTNVYCPPPPLCNDGETKQQDCNTCTCMNGAWGCNTKACPPSECKEGETRSDGCNNCSCAGGQWACTARFCPTPDDAGPAPKGCGGWLGDTCTQNEYCAYTEGQLCGATDASSHCAPRAYACGTVYNPVCGCNNKTYGNACEAGMARTGVFRMGTCAVNG